MSAFLAWIREWIAERREWKAYLAWIARVRPPKFTPSPKITPLPPGHYEPGTYEHEGCTHRVFIAFDVTPESYARDRKNMGLE